FPRVLMPAQYRVYVEAASASVLPPDHATRVRSLEATALLEGERILAEAPYVHAAIRDFDIEIVPLHSPEVSFLFDAELSTMQMRERLRELNIEYMIFEKQNRGWDYFKGFAFFNTEVDN